MQYYIYRWYNTDNDYTFYIGKGIGNRYKEKREKKEIKFLTNIIRKIIVIVK